ncbi:hypothetical protein [Tenacibaculum caenipelagi]|uniref:Uncharacterized protein n=1 Tax=Tenacibaculum caenipelagi TaxID=1325435 RepID=A0A4R6TCK4_9FLAO|nr:hypothetical protein [Tenacibaculum caenipelagi]TDQ25753.1 hypothetical protein DFQ07_2184 [Tenacibaculum caenipelagi]
MIKQTLNWYEGEIFEAKFILAFGIAIVIIAFLFRYFGNTPYAKALLIPLLVAGLIISLIGSLMLMSNQRKMETVEQNFMNDNEQFAKSEKQRVEDFQYLYPLSLGISVVCFFLTFIFLAFTKNMYLHASAIAIALFGLTFIIIDYFSKERANIYYEQINHFLLQYQ